MELGTLGEVGRRAGCEVERRQIEEEEAPGPGGVECANYGSVGGEDEGVEEVGRVFSAILEGARGCRLAPACSCKISFMCEPCRFAYTEFALYPKAGNVMEANGSQVD